MSKAITSHHASTNVDPLAPYVLSESELNQVSGGGGLTHFVKAVVIAGTAEAGGSGSTDPNTVTYTQVWVTSAS